MFETLKFRRRARDGASGWADEAVELWGYNAATVMREQVRAHDYPARYSFEYCLAEIEKRDRQRGLIPPSLIERAVALTRTHATRLFTKQPSATP